MQLCVKKIKSRPEATALGDAMSQRLKTPFQCVRPLLVKSSASKKKNNTLFRRSRRGRIRLRDAGGVVTNLVNKVDDHVVLLHAHSVKMLAHGQSKLVLALATSLLTPNHGRRMEANSVRLREDPLTVGVGEGARGVEAMLATVSMEDVSLESGPL